VALRFGSAAGEDREQRTGGALHAPALRLVEQALVRGAGHGVERIG
jgi:hypothetical protein